MEIKQVSVIGAGLMGSGISQVCAQAGYRVTMQDVSQQFLDKAMKSIEWSVGKFVEKGRIKESAEKVLSRITLTTEINAAKEADFVVEAVPEVEELKKKIFLELDGLCRPEVILATNTSAIPITKIASATKYPERVVGTHFFSPVPLMMVVEVVKGMRTSEETMENSRKWVCSLGKEYINVNKDIAGFVLNRINIPSTIEAIRLVEAGVTTPEDIDKGMRLAFGRAMGPFETGDMTGIDVAHNAYFNIYAETNDPKFLPPALLQRMVQAGLHGRKAGKGWYDYNSDGTKKERK
jgi:3-hydroxybutyryl-CoA dehydrogenase